MNIRMCPEHAVSLVAVRTKYGTRYGCPVDGCTVRCWDGSTTTPCDQQTAYLRQRCHAAFDPLWKRGTRKYFRHRGEAYRWLADIMQIEQRHCHIGMFTADECRHALDRIKELNERTQHVSAATEAR